MLWGILKELNEGRFCGVSDAAVGVFETRDDGSDKATKL